MLTYKLIYMQGCEDIHTLKYILAHIQILRHTHNHSHPHTVSTAHSHTHLRGLCKGWWAGSWDEHSVLFSEDGSD